MSIILKSPNINESNYTFSVTVDNQITYGLGAIKGVGLAIIENIIESGHNGIVSWERESTMTPILLTGKDDHKKTKERWNIIHEYFEMKNIDYKEVSTIDGGILSKVICMIYILDYTSIYYAVRLGIDPSPINSIDFIKDRL